MNTEYSLLIKKMRLLKGLSRQKASELFNFSYQNIEKLENGRGLITLQKLKLFQNTYGFTNEELEDLRTGKIKAPTDANIIRRKAPNRERTRRFKNRVITRECKVLKELRLIKGIDQHEASRLCGAEKILLAILKMEEFI